MLLTFIILAAFAISVAGPNLLQSWDNYTIHFSDTSVRGVSQGSPVYFNGIAIGSVLELSLLPEDMRTVIVKIAVDSAVPIRTDMKAQLVTAGITGATNIELTGGSPESAILEPGSRIPSQRSLLDQFTGPAMNITRSVEEVVNDAGYLMDPANPASITRAMLNLNRILETNNDNINIIVENVALSSQQLSASLYQTNRILSRVNDLIYAAELGQEGGELGRAAIDLADIILQGRADISASLENLRITSENLAQFSFLISEDPSLILRSRGD